ncbi:hypothetical protein Tco_1491469 [Tanacetum coccineum]
MSKAKSTKKIDWNDPSVIRYHALKMKPKTIAQARRNMIKYLKNQGNFKISDFKGMSYNNIRPIFEKVWDFNQHIEPIDMEHGSEKMKSPEKIEEEVVKESGAKRKKSLPRKRTVKRQKLEEAAEKEELKGFLDIILREDVAEDVESLSTNSKNYKVLSEMLEDFYRQDVDELYRLVKEMFTIHMLTEKKYPLSQETITKMLNRRLEVEHESSQAFELLRIDQGVGSTSGIRACALRNFDLGVMELENTQNNALAKLPMLKLGEYEMWEIRIKQYFQIQDYALWEVIENGNSWVPIPVTATETGPSTGLKMTVPSTAEEKNLKTELEKVKEEKEGFEFKIAKFEKSAKDLDQMLESQITDKSKKGVGYHAVPSPHPLILKRLTPLDLSYSGLEEFKQPEFNEYGPRDSSLKPNNCCDKESDNSKEILDDSLKQQQKTDSKTSSVKSPLKANKDWKEKFFNPANHVREEEPKKAREDNDAPII